MTLTPSQQSSSFAWKWHIIQQPASRWTHHTNKMRLTSFLTLPLLANALVTNDLSTSEQHLLAPEATYLIELEGNVQKWVSEDEKWALKRQGIRFFDITDHTDDNVVRVQRKISFPDDVAQNSSITPLFKHIDKSRMEEFLAKFSGFHTRYYKSEYGRQSSEWLSEQVNATLTEAGVGSVEIFRHAWGQNSIVARLPGKSEKTVVVGAHQDSINMFLPSVFAAPGADDDGSGTTVTLEALRVLLQDKAILKGKAENTIEFHWYSAEEGGLLGSQAIFNSYAKAERDVVAMLQQDMTGFTKGMLDAGIPESLGIITDFVDQQLVGFIKKVVDAYCDIPYIETKCGYACSDHASASKAGYPSAFVIESPFELGNKRIHTTEDKIELLDFGHMAQHTKLTVAFAYELAFAKIK